MITKFVKDDQFITLEYDLDSDECKVTASSDELIAKYREFEQRELNEESGPNGDFYADIDGLEAELQFIRVKM